MISKIKHRRTNSDQIRNDDRKEKKQTATETTPSLSQASTLFPSSQMPPPQSTLVPISIITKQLANQRRSSCFEAVSNSSLDESSSSPVSYNTNDNQPHSLKGLLKGKFFQSNLSRSQSDSQKKRAHTLKLLKSVRSLSSDSFPVLKSSDTVSSKASDSTSEADALHTLPEEGGKQDVLANKQPSIMVLEDEEDEEIEGVQLYACFKDVYGHLNRRSVFLHFLLENSDPVPLLFCVMVDVYKQASAKEQAKWAYELYSSFIHPSAPLRLQGDLETSRLDALMKERLDKEELGGLFDDARAHCEQLCRQLLLDFNYKLSMGLGGLYGLQHNDSASLLQSLSSQHSLLSKQTDERSLLLAASVVTFMRVLGWHGNAASFLHKEKSKLTLFPKASKKGSLGVQDHHLSLHHFTITYHCQHCTLLVSGLSPQAFLCLRCDQAFHKACAGQLVERCVGSRKVDRSKTTATAATALMRKKNLRSSKGPPDDSDSGATLPRAVSLMSFKESATPAFFRPPSKHKLPRDDRVDQSDTSASQRSAQAKSLFIDSSQHPSLPPSLTSQRSPTSLPHDSDPLNNTMGTTTQSQYALDSDFECESEGASLEGVYGREVLRRMKKEERRRQNVILELLHTERTHVRNLKVIHNLIHLPLTSSQPPTFVSLLFPNLPALIAVHDELNRALKERQRSMDGQAITSITDVLLAHFTGERQGVVRDVCAIFCEKQGQALDELRSRQKKDPKLACLLQEAQTHPLCRRFELKDMLPTAMQRLTKYPLLISNILKHTQDADECRGLQAALEGSRDLLEHVNSVVRKHDNHLRLQHLQGRLEKKNADNHPVMMLYQDLSLTQHSLLLEGDMLWRINREKVCDVHALLLHDLLLLPLKVDDRLVLKVHSTYITAGRHDTRTNHCPIIPLSNILIKASASDDKAFFLVSQLYGSDPQFYDLVASSCEEKNKWCKQIEGAVESFRKHHPDLCHQHMHKPHSHRKTPSSVSTTSLPPSSPIPPPNITRSSTIPASNQPSFPSSLDSTTSFDDVTQQHDVTHEADVTVQGEDSRHTCKEAADSSGYHLIERLHGLNACIDELMKQKWEVLEELGGAEVLNDGTEEGGLNGGVESGIVVGRLGDVEWLLGQVEELMSEVGGGSETVAGGSKGQLGASNAASRSLLVKALLIERKAHSLSQHLFNLSTHSSTFSDIRSSSLPSTSPSLTPTIQSLNPSPTPPPINPTTYPLHDVCT